MRVLTGCWIFVGMTILSLSAWSHTAEESMISYPAPWTHNQNYFKITCSEILNKAPIPLDPAFETILQELTQLRLKQHQIDTDSHPRDGHHWASAWSNTILVRESYAKLKHLFPESTVHEILTEVNKRVSQAVKGLHHVKENSLSSQTPVALQAPKRNRIEVYRPKFQYELERIGGSMNATVFSPQGDLIATGAAAGELLFWDARTGFRLREINIGIDKVIHALAFSPNGERVAIGTNEGLVEFRKVSDGAFIGRVKLPSDLSTQSQKAPITNLVFSPDGQQLAVDRSTTGAFVIHLNSVQSLKGNSAENITAMTYSRTGVLITGSLDGKIKLWNPFDGQEMRTLSALHVQINSISLHLENQILAVAGSNGTTYIIGINDGTVIAKLKGQNRSAIHTAFSADGKHLLSGFLGGALKFWDTSDWKLYGEVTGLHNWINAASFSPQGDQILTNGIGQIWQIFESVDIEDTLKDSQD